MKPDGETQSYMNSNEIMAGSKEIMTHAQRQAFLKTSRLGKLLGVAHLLPESDVKPTILSISEKTFTKNVFVDAKRMKVGDLVFARILLVENTNSRRMEEHEYVNYCIRNT